MVNSADKFFKDVGYFRSLWTKDFFEDELKKEAALRGFTFSAFNTKGKDDRKDKIITSVFFATIYEFNRRNAFVLVGQEN
jgi:hypothetical protein